MDQRLHNDRLLILLKLAEYQEQAYLLDPFLERLVTPVVEQFKASIIDTAPEQNAENIGHLAILLYYYVNFRGYKAISELHFPCFDAVICLICVILQHVSSLTKSLIFLSRSTSSFHPIALQR